LLLTTKAYLLNPKGDGIGYENLKKANINPFSSAFIFRNTKPYRNSKSFNLTSRSSTSSSLSLASCNFQCADYVKSAGAFQFSTS